MKRKKLYRSNKDRVIGGICGGLGEYFEVDPTVLRFVWVIITVFTGIVPGILIYIIALFIIPLDSDREQSLQKTVIEVGGEVDPE